MTQDRRLAELQDAADHARRRHSLYKAKTYGSQPTSPHRLSELKRGAERAASALDRAQTDTPASEARSHG